MHSSQMISNRIPTRTRHLEAQGARTRMETNPEYIGQQSRGYTKTPTFIVIR
jgi:hypothetical protein